MLEVGDKVVVSNKKLNTFSSVGVVVDIEDYTDKSHRKITVNLRDNLVTWRNHSVHHIVNYREDSLTKVNKKPVDGDLCECYCVVVYTTKANIEKFSDAINSDAIICSNTFACTNKELVIEVAEDFITKNANSDVRFWMSLTKTPKPINLKQTIEVM